MSKTISNIQTAQYNLIASGNPLTITSTGGVETPGAVAIIGNTAQAWTVGNAGTVIGSYGIELAKGGVVTNTGSIIVTSGGVQISGARGTVSNSGKILGGFDGVVLYDGGTVTNLAGGTIAGNGNVGVYLSGAAATLTNAGTISGSHLAVAVVGAITSRIIVDPGAVFIGNVQGGSGSNTLELAKGSSATGTIGGIGTQFTGFGTIAVDTGATWSLVNTGTLSGVTSLINHGTLVGSGAIDARSLFNDGTIAAAAKLTVGVSLVNQGSIATTVTLAAGAIFDNGGTINKTEYAVYGVGGPAFVTNSGLLVGYAVIYLKGGGAVTNLSGGIIASDSGLAGVVIANASGTVTNSGTIIGATDAVYFGDGGTISNLSGGVLRGGRFGLAGAAGGVIEGGAGTIINAGTIIGSAGADAVAFEGNYTDRLIVDPGAVFTGAAQGGSGSNTLELAAGSAGNTGTISGLGTQFLGFQTIDIDAGASWSLTNPGSIATGVTLAAGASLNNSGTIIAGALSGVSGSGAPVFVSNSGSIAGVYGVQLKAGGRVTNAAGAWITGSDGEGIDISQGPGTVINAGGSILGAFDGVYLRAGGSISNLSGRLDGHGDFGVEIEVGSGTVVNGGTISGYDGILLGGGGTIINMAAGVLQGTGDIGADIVRGSGTIINAGTIIGNADDQAVYFGGNFTDRLIVDPGAVFVGRVQGGGGSNTLELAAGISGNTGTITGLGTQFLGFGTIDVDAGAAWSLVNAGTLASGTTLTDSGVLTMTGSLGVGGSLAVAGGAATGAGGSLFNAGTLGVTGTLELQAGVAYTTFLGAGGVLTNTGTLTNGGTVLIDGADGGGFTASGAGAPGGTLANTGVLLNSGRISLGGGLGGSYSFEASGAGGVLNDSGTLVNTGTISLAGGGARYSGSDKHGGYGAGLVIGGTLVNSGSLGIGAGTTGMFGAGYAAVVTVTSTGTLSGAGTVRGGGSLINDGTILASGTVAVSYLLNVGTIGASTKLTDAGNLVNQGSIATGVTLATGATLDNAGSIGVASSLDGVEGSAPGGVVINSRMISGGIGIKLTDGGVVTNLPGASITGTSSGGVFIGGASGTVTNEGGEISGSYAIQLRGGGTVSNLSSGVLVGTRFNAAYVVSGTVINAGTIIETGLDEAVGFGGTANRLIIDPGAVFTGAVQGNGGSDTLELAPGSAGNTGTISGIGTQFFDFPTIDVDAGAAWAFDASDTLGSAVTIGDAGSMIFSETLGHTVTVAAPVSGGGGVQQSGPGKLVLNGNDSFTGGVTLASGILELASGNGAAGNGITFAGTGIVQFDGLPTGTIYGFANTATIDLPSYSYLQGAQATLAAGNTLVVQSGSGSFDLLLDPTQDFGGVLFSVHQDAGTGILVEEASAPCYARGTQLLTAQGEVAIEALRVGDEVVTASGALRPVRWIGRRSYAGGTIGGNRDILPICLRAGALAEGVPRRDLHVSPKHAMFLDGVLIPAELLVNGVSIVQPAHVEALTYFHVELDSHDVLIADGAPSESFIDHDSRVMFDNAAAFGRVHPARREDCAPRVEDGEVLARVRQRLAARAGLVADHAGDAAEAGPLDGRIDLLDGSEVAGWAFDARRPHTPIRLDILDGERVIGTVVANRFRPDLRPAGKGDGRCAYVFRFDRPPADLRGISLRRSSDGAMLPAQEAELRAA